MKTLIIAMLAAVIGGGAVWGYGEAMSNRNDSALAATLRGIAESFVDAANRGDRGSMEELAVGRARSELGYTFEQHLPEFISPPLGPMLIVAAEQWGPATIERFTLDAVGESAVLATMATTYPPSTDPSRRSMITNTGGYLIFEREEGSWFIASAIVG